MITAQSALELSLKNKGRTLTKEEQSISVNLEIIRNRIWYATEHGETSTGHDFNDAPAEVMESVQRTLEQAGYTLENKILGNIGKMILSISWENANMPV